MRHGIYVIRKGITDRNRVIRYKAEAWYKGTRIESTAWGLDKADVLKAIENNLKIRNDR
jgi:hypothetical protein